jgi:signal transduction histidine kinase
MATLSASFSQSNEMHQMARTQLSGTWLWLARGSWCLVALASLGMFVAILPLILSTRDYGDWTIEASSPLFGINLFTPAFETYALLFLGLKYLGVAVFFGVALYIFWSKSDDWLAILVSVTLLVLPHTFNLVGYTEAWYQYPFPWDKIWSALDALFNGLGFALLFMMFFLFPDGRFVPRWTIWFAFLPFFLVAAIGVSDFFNVSLIADDRIPWLALILVFLALLLLATWSQIYRYRNVSTRAQQTQTRLVVLSLVTIVTTLTLLFAISLFGIPFGEPSFMDSSLGALVTFLIDHFVLMLLPIAFGVAMLRDQLWQSERALNRAFLYATLSAILLVVYVLVVAALSEGFRAMNNFLIAAIATGVVALLFQPLRERLQRGINRSLYGQRDEPFTVLNQLGAQLENSIAPDSALPLVVETIGKNLRVPYVAVALSDEGKGLRTEWGRQTQSSVLSTFPLKYQNERVGELDVARRAPNENFSAADLQLLENLARQAGAVAYTARLHAQLQQSRERIITEREQERKRLRRDLHDGLGPTLASQTLKLDAALDMLDENPIPTERARALLQGIKAHMQATVADTHRTVYELRPPALDDLGLLGALRAHILQYDGLNGLKITLDAPQSLPPLSAAVQLNAYRIVLEAVNNVLKHARATDCVVRIAANGGLSLEIGDNGVGLANDFRAGVGIASMRERAQELGGTFQIEPNAPQGTRVFATLPISNP